MFQSALEKSLNPERILKRHAYKSLSKEVKSSMLNMSAKDIRKKFGEEVLFGFCTTFGLKKDIKQFDKKMYKLFVKYEDEGIDIYHGIWEN